MLFGGLAEPSTLTCVFVEVAIDPGGSLNQGKQALKGVSGC